MTDRRDDLAHALVGHAADSVVAAALDATRVVVAVPARASQPVAVAAAAVAAITGRIFGDVVVRGDATLGLNPWRGKSVAEVAGLGARGAASTTEVVVAVGDNAGAADWYIGGDDFTVVVSRTPVAIRPCRHGGLGLQAGAAITAGELLKTALAPFGMRAVVADCIVWNLLDGQLTVAPHVGEGAHVPANVAFLAAGSVGGSAIAVTSMTEAGDDDQAVVVDLDDYDPARNNYRCPGVHPDEHGPKADWGRDLLQAAGWSAEAHNGTLASWVATQPSPGFDGVLIVSVDRVDVRRDAADALARTTISAGVAGMALHVQAAIATEPDLACPYCQYVDVAPPLSRVQVLAELSGLAPRRVVELLAGDRLTDADVDAAAVAGIVTHGPSLVGGRLENLIKRRYAQTDVVIEGVTATVSAPQVSWLAGVLLAAEITKARLGLPLINRRAELDMTGVPLGGWRRPVRDTSGRCLCASPIRRSVTARLYGP